MKFRVTEKFGVLSEVHRTPHSGYDIAMPIGTPLRAFDSAVVERVVDYGAQNIGKGVILRLEDGRTAIYGHLSRIDVSRGDHVGKGDLLGLSGNTGNSTGPHLHIGLKDEGGRLLNPEGPITNFLREHPGPVTKYYQTKDNGSILDRVADNIADGLADGWDLMIDNITGMLPEIGCGVTIICGILIMLTRNVGKIAVWWSIIMGVIIFWLSGGGD